MIKAVGDRVIVQKDARGPTEIGGILIPESLVRTPRFSPTVFGKVVSAGPKCRSVKTGQRVALKNHAGDDWLIEENTYTILRERDLIGTLK